MPDGRFPRLFRRLTKTQLLILDDWGPEQLTTTQRRDLMEIVEDRYGTASTMITSQLPLKSWHDVIGDPTFADAILDRIVHNALYGDSVVKGVVSPSLFLGLRKVRGSHLPRNASRVTALYSVDLISDRNHDAFMDTLAPGRSLGKEDSMT